MQDEVREKSVVFVIRVSKTGGKLTASMLKYAMEQYLEQQRTLTFDLKAEKFSKKTASFLPSREDSYERLLETNQQFMIREVSVQVQMENLLDAEMVRKALPFLNPEGRELISLLFYQEKNRTGGRNTASYLPSAPPQYACLGNPEVTAV